MKCRADFTFEADLDDVTKGWKPEERQALIDGTDEEATDAALTRLVELALNGRAEEIGIPYLDIR